MDGKNRSDIQIGDEVAIVKKADQRSNTLTKGVVQAILTKSPSHAHGIKVRLESGEIGRVKQIINAPA
ncbi:MAG: YwbE family protein [Bacteroidales bacterium]|nr:YwbE family protein [Bacteroidales bacterium]